MRAEIIAIGDELTSGQRLDTNTQWLSQQLGELGVPTIRHTTVGDDLDSNVEAMRQAALRAEIVVCSGGLGPTLDDLTRQAMADAFARPLQLQEASLQRIQAMFASRGREMPERNRSQALFPMGSLAIPNPHGTAPGIDLALEMGEHPCRLFALPGVPAEMIQMWHESVVPRIEAMLGLDLGPLRYHAIKLFGIGESDVEVKLPKLIERDRYPKVGITVSRATITLRIAARAPTSADFNQLIQPTIDEIQLALGDLIFGAGEDELQHAVAGLLIEKRLSMASVEVGAASWIGDWMLNACDPTTTPYRGGLSFPTLDAACLWLEADRPRAVAKPHATSDLAEAPDDDDWKAIAVQARARFDADVVLVVGVYPTCNQMENAQTPFSPVFTLAIKDHVLLVHRSMAGHPDVLGPRIAKTGMDMVRKSLLCTR